MTKQHATVQLLRHGRLNMHEFQKITGWDYECCCNALRRARRNGKVKLVRRGGSPECTSIYELAA